MTDRLKEDHENAAHLGALLDEIDGVQVFRDRLDIDMVFFTADWDETKPPVIPIGCWSTASRSPAAQAESTVWFATTIFPAQTAIKPRSWCAHSPRRGDPCPIIISAVCSGWSWAWLVSAIGITMMLQANIGLEPWSVLQQGLAQTLGITYGTASMIVGAFANRCGRAMRESFASAQSSISSCVRCSSTACSGWVGSRRCIRCSPASRCC